MCFTVCVFVRTRKNLPLKTVYYFILSFKAQSEFRYCQHVYFTFTDTVTALCVWDRLSNAFGNRTLIYCRYILSNRNSIPLAYICIRLDGVCQLLYSFRRFLSSWSMILILIYLKGTRVHDTWWPLGQSRSTILFFVVLFYDVLFAMLNAAALCVCVYDFWNALEKKCR